MRGYKIPGSQPRYQRQSLKGSRDFRDPFVVRVAECVDLCFRHPGCVAFNFHQSEKLCELLSRFEAVVPREGFRYKIFDHSTFRAVRKKLKVFSSAMVKFHNSVLVFLKSVIRK